MTLFPSFGLSVSPSVRLFACVSVLSASMSVFLSVCQCVCLSLSVLNVRDVEMSAFSEYFLFILFSYILQALMEPYCLAWYHGPERVSPRYLNQDPISEYTYQHIRGTLLQPYESKVHYSTLYPIWGDY